ncbi:MAG: PEP-CTERM sorting domain-containing protein [Kiritimatiellae bacterium]|nr:PEP-CTERM sorting domain-containing protein [Kiritimatiellia bacterium]
MKPPSKQTNKRSSIRFLLLTIFMSIAFSVRCEDSYLYWMVTTEDDYWPRFSAAALRTMESADGDKSASTLLDVKAPEDLDETTQLGTYVNTYTVFGSGLYEGWTFFVELLNFNPSTGEYSHSAYLPGYGYDELVRSGALLMDYMTPTGLTFGNAFNLSAVPEPSSGLMLLLDLAAVGLRRKRQSLLPHA